MGGRPGGQCAILATIDERIEEEVEEGRKAEAIMLPTMPSEKEIEEQRQNEVCAALTNEGVKMTRFNDAIRTFHFFFRIF